MNDTQFLVIAVLVVFGLVVAGVVIYWVILGLAMFALAVALFILDGPTYFRKGIKWSRSLWSSLAQ